jgi:hypothetical protein
MAFFSDCDICLTCYSHFAGPVGSEVFYSREEWDAMIMKTFDND